LGEPFDFGHGKLFDKLRTSAVAVKSVTTVVFGGTSFLRRMVPRRMKFVQQSSFTEGEPKYFSEQ
jgi:hypothetical protein